MRSFCYERIFLVTVSAIMYGSIPPVTFPRATPEQVRLFGPGDGELYEAVLSRGDPGWGTDQK